jgi:hypothetical protein
MKEKPIIFSGPMVKALLNTQPNIWPAEAVDPGKPYKRMTRRVIKPRYKTGEAGFELSRQSLNIRIVDEEGMTVREDGPAFWPGDILWVREAFKAMPRNKLLNLPPSVGEDGWWTHGGLDYCYRADDTSNNPDNKWHPSIFMPREAARLFLEVKAVRIERLQEISPEDAEGEGVDITGYDLGPYAKTGDYYTWAYQCLWNDINGKKYPWDSNPWVWVYEFMRIEREEQL